jgi:Raf kinase inhibitor-like YbhB/YbcL family protein
MTWRTTSPAVWGAPLALAAALGWAGCGTTEGLLDQDAQLMTLRLTSPAFGEGGMIPKAYTCDGANRSPPLAWSGVPSPARSLALVCDDPDAPSGTWSHWVLFNLPPEVRSLREGLPPDDPLGLVAGTPVRQGENDFGKIGYGGPCPPGGTHRYRFRLFALDTMLELKAGATRSTLIEAVKGHVLAHGLLTGKYAR